MNVVYVVVMVLHVVVMVVVQISQMDVIFQKVLYLYYQMVMSYIMFQLI